MTQRANHPPQDFQKMCKQAERDLESKKLAVLIERVKRQLEEQKPETAKSTLQPKPPMAVMASSLRRPSRLAFFER